MNKSKLLLKKIKEKKVKIAIIGLGYVGLPLALLFVKKGFMVEGYTKTDKKVTALRNGITDLHEFSKELKKALKTKRFTINTTAEKQLEKTDVVIICVPTPVNKHKQPDLTSLRDVANRLSQMNLTDKLIINESTVAPLTTKTILGSLGGKYFLVSSPERINPGSTRTVENIPKVIGGIDNESLLLGATLYQQILKKELVTVSSMEVAEMSKMLENTYRAVNIALINEFANLAETLDIDILDVITAAKSKWSFQAHFPSIGVGGHCIPVDPYYIVKLAKEKNLSMPTITSGLQSNETMPFSIAQKIAMQYKKGSSILIYGLTYKKNVADLRESPVLVLCEELKQKNIPFTVYDPLLENEKIKQLGYTIAQLNPVDIFVVGTDHKQLGNDYHSTIAAKTIVIDGRNFFQKRVGKKVLGVGRTLK